MIYLNLVKDVVVCRYDLPFYHPTYFRRVLTPMQFPQLHVVFGVSFRPASIMSNVVHPGRCVVSLRPHHWILEIAHESPSLRPIPNANSPPFPHQGKKIFEVIVLYFVQDEDRDRPAPRYDVQLQFRLAKGIQGVKIKRCKNRHWKHEPN